MGPNSDYRIFFKWVGEFNHQLVMGSDEQTEPLLGFDQYILANVFKIIRYHQVICTKGVLFGSRGLFSPGLGRSKLPWMVAVRVVLMSPVFFRGETLLVLDVLGSCSFQMVIHRIHVYFVYLHLPGESTKHVSKYTVRPMDPCSARV